MENADRIQIKEKRNNNFAVLRLCAAFMVLSGHMGHIIAGAVPTLLGRQIQSLGVYVFFLIGGYLITKSWMSDPHPVRYAIKRFMRIWPPLAAFVLFAAYIAGPILSTLSVKEYFLSRGYLEYLRNLALNIRYSLPGVFTENPYPNAVNGSLWTLPVEAMMYLIIPLMVALIGLRKNTKVSKCLLVFASVVVCFLDCYVYTYRPDLRIVVYGTDWISALHIVPFYFIGAVCTVPQLRKYFNLQVAVVLLLVFSCLNMSYVNTQMWLYLVMPYIVFSLAFSPMPAFSWLEGKAEISYGLYLYGFFIQQVVVDIARRYGWQIGFMPALVISCIFTVIASYVSYYLVERPALRICNKILKRIN